MNIKGIIILVLTAFIICVWPWGSFGWMITNDYPQVKYSDAIKSATEYTVPNETYLRVNNDRIKIPSGTKLKVLGLYLELPVFRSRYHYRLVEMPDGTRGLTDEPDDVQTGVFYFDHSCEDDIFCFHRIITIEEASELTGHTFSEVQDILGPATFCYQANKDQIFACFPGYNYLNKDVFERGFIASFKDGEMIGYKAMENKKPYGPMWFHKFANFWMSRSLAYNNNGAYSFQKKGNLSSRNFKYRWIGRGIMGIVDSLVPIIISLLVLFLSYFTIARIRAFSNAFINGIMAIVILSVVLVYVIYTMNFSVNLLFTYFSTGLGLSFCVDSTSKNRCPSCHRVDTLEIANISKGETTDISFSNSLRTRGEETEFNRLSRGYEREYDVNNYRITHRATVQDWNIKLRCSHCGRVVSTTKHISQSGGSTIKHTGTDHYKETVTW